MPRVGQIDSKLWRVRRSDGAPPVLGTLRPAKPMAPSRLMEHKIDE
jgi:hypothetical protein